MELVAADIGGTHARFTIASVADGGAVTLNEPVKLKTSEFASLQSAWAAFQDRLGRPAPKAAAIAIAAPVTGAVVRMTNNSWVIQTAGLDAGLGLDHVILLNDFAAVAHAAANTADADFVHLCGPDKPLPTDGTVSVLGPGTGLGIAHFHRFPQGYRVQATEGAHVDFAPVDAVDDMLLQRLRKQHRRVSVERIVSGPGVVEIRAVLAALEHRTVSEMEDKAIWQAGLGETDALCTAAVERFCQSLGSVAGDYALAHGASGVVIAGGLGYRIRERLIRSGFAERFTFKGRYQQMMAGIPVKLITHAEPGLFGAACAFLQQNHEEPVA